MANARRILTLLLTMALLIAAFPGTTVVAAAATPKAYASGEQIKNLVGTIEVSYLTPDKKSYVVKLLLDTAIQVTGIADPNGVARTHWVTQIALDAPAKNDGKRAKVNGTLVSSVTLGVYDATNLQCALKPAKITVFKPAKSVKILKKPKKLAVTGDYQLSVRVKPSGAEQYVSWSSSNEDVLMVMYDGTVCTYEPGTAVITATARNGKKASMSVQVVEPVKGVALSQSNLYMKKGTSSTLTASVSPSDATNKGVKWSSSNKKVATVNADGKVTAKKNGKATITVKTKDGAFTAKCAVVVSADGGTPESSPHLFLDGKRLELPHTLAEATAALTGWTKTIYNGFTTFTNPKYLESTLSYDPKGRMYWLTSMDAGAIKTSAGITVGSSLADVLAKGGTPEANSVENGEGGIVYLLPVFLQNTQTPLMWSVRIENSRVIRITYSPVGSEYDQEEPEGEENKYPHLFIDGMRLPLPHTLTNVLAALDGWTRTTNKDGFFTLTNPKYPESRLMYDPKGRIFMLTAKEANAIKTSAGITVGSSLADVVAKGGTPAQNSVNNGEGRLVYQLPVYLQETQTPLMMKIWINDSRVSGIDVMPVGSEYDQEEPEETDTTPHVFINGKKLPLPHTLADAEAAMTGWTRTTYNGFVKFANPQYPESRLSYDPKGRMYRLTSMEPGVITTSAGITVGSSLADVLAKGGTPEANSVENGEGSIVYILPVFLQDTQTPLMWDVRIENSRVVQIWFSPIGSEYDEEE